MPTHFAKEVVVHNILLFIDNYIKKKEQNKKQNITSPHNLIVFRVNEVCPIMQCIVQSKH